MPAPLLALALLGLFGGHADPARVSSHVYHVGGWRLHVTRDPFAGTTACKLRTGSARVERGRLIWALGGGVESAHAVYRIDAGAPRLQSAIALPATANLINPSNGAVVVPVSELVGAQRLQVRASPGARLRSLNVAGLDEALAQAAQAGCATPANAPAEPPVS